MSITIKKISDVKNIDKPWGYEKWIAEGSPNFKYALKEILFKSKFKSSLQFHEFKEETTYIQKGQGILHYYPQVINVKDWKSGQYSDDEINSILTNLNKVELHPGMVYHIKPGTIHQVEAISDITIIEASTVELDDVIRINDEWGRKEGKKNMNEKNLVLDNIYDKQQARYEFVSESCAGSILVYDALNIMPYHGSKILLEKDANMVVTCDVSNNDYEYSSRKYSSDGNIVFSNLNETSTSKTETYDCIFHSEILQDENNPEQKIKEFYNLLKKNGKLIIAIVNQENQSQIYQNSNISADFSRHFTKDEFLKILKTQFSQIDLYSQKLITKRDVISRQLHPWFLFKVKLRFFLSTLLLKFDPKSNFYNKFIKTKVRGLNSEFADQSSDVNNSNAIISNDYTPVPYSETDNPLFFIAVCQKNSH